MKRPWKGISSSSQRADVTGGYRLGECEQARGRPDAALAAWSRVAPGSLRGLDAALARGRLVLELGRFTETEQALTGALGGATKSAGPRPHAFGGSRGRRGWARFLRPWRAAIA